MLQTEPRARSRQLRASSARRSVPGCSQGLSEISALPQVCYSRAGLGPGQESLTGLSPVAPKGFALAAGGPCPLWGLFAGGGSSSPRGCRVPRRSRRLLGWGVAAREADAGEKRFFHRKWLYRLLWAIAQIALQSCPPKKMRARNRFSEEERLVWGEKEEMCSRVCTSSKTRGLDLSPLGLH